MKRRVVEETVCRANDSEATASIQGPTLRAETVANGSDSDTTATVAQTICYEVGADGSLAVNMTIIDQRFEKFCPSRNGHSHVGSKPTIRREGYAPLVIYDAAASIGCDDGDITNEGFPPCTETIADIRFFCAGSDFISDVLQLNAGDSFAADLDLTAESQLPIDAVDGDVTEARVGATYSLSAGFLTIVPCASATSCVNDGDCSGQDELCLDENCRVPTFGANLGPVFTIDPDPVSSGQLFSMRVTLSATEGELIPVSIVASVPDTAMAASGSLAAGQVGGACLFDSTQRFLIATGTPNEFCLDTDQSFTFDQGEPTVAYGASGSGEFVFDIDIPPSGIRTTVAADATVVCSFNTLFLAGAERTYPIQVDATSIVFDTGVDPRTYSSSD